MSPRLHGPLTDGFCCAAAGDACACGPQNASYNLFNYVNEVNAEVEVLEDGISKVRSEIEAHLEQVSTEWDRLACESVAFSMFQHCLWRSWRCSDLLCDAHWPAAAGSFVCWFVFSTAALRHQR